MTPSEKARFRMFIVSAAVSVGTLVYLFSSHPMALARAVHQRSGSTADAPPKGPKQQTAAQAAPTPVLVELFTSEGCSSCPPADSLLARLQREQPVAAADILTLEEHVDYWDSLGWRDRFGSSQFSARQSAYMQRLRLNSEYTPQMIVDGTDEFAGNDVVHALHAIGRAARAPKLPLTLSALSFDGRHMAGAVSLARRTGASGKADLYAAVVERMASTQVLAGENDGQTLNHVSVVRAMRKIGNLSRAKTAPLKFSLDVPANADVGGLRVVVFIQREGQGAVLGAIASPAAAGGSTVSLAAALSPSGR